MKLFDIYIRNKKWTFWDNLATEFRVIAKDKDELIEKM